MEFIEVETKYNAKKIKLSDFKAINDYSLGLFYGHPRFRQVASYDHYFHKNGKHPMRHREGPDPQLTVKARTSKFNNFVRREANVDLLPNTDQKSVIAALADILGLKDKFSIFKDSQIYFYNGFNTVFYTVYTDDTRSHLLGYYVEIEMDEKYPWDSEEQAWGLLKEIEKKLKPLGISPQKRIKKSLFDLYRNV